MSSSVGVIPNILPSVTIKWESRKVKCYVCGSEVEDYMAYRLGKYTVCSECFEGIFTWLVDRYMEVVRDEEHQD